MRDQKNFTLYYSSFDRYEACPQAFLWGRGWGTLDVGGGPGRPKPVPVEKSRHHMVLGIAIQWAVERMYNDGLWQLPNLKERLLEIAEEGLERELARGGVDWRVSPSHAELIKLVQNGVTGFLRTMKQHKLLGPYAKAEVDLVGYVDKYTPIGGRADTVIRRDDTGITILDGKNSKRYLDPKTKKFITYTDPDQLRWYALCFYLAYRQMPDRLGFVYYRYPYGDPKLDTEGKETGEIESGVDWVPFTKDDIKGLARRAKDALLAIHKEKFDANPKPSLCRLCDYETVCPQRQAQRQENSRNRKSPDAFFDGLTGVQSFGFGAGGSVHVPEE